MAMATVSRFIRVNVPDYLYGLPIPESVGEFKELQGKEWRQLMVASGACLAIGYAVARPCYEKYVLGSSPRINRKINLDQEQVSGEINVEDLGERTGICRCWMSDQFPYCDGSHKKGDLERRL